MDRLVLPFCGSFRPDVKSFTSLKHFCKVCVIDFLEFANESFELRRVKLHQHVGKPNFEVFKLRMVEASLYVRGEKFVSCRLLAASCRLDGHKHGVDFGENVRIIEL